MILWLIGRPIAPCHAIKLEIDKCPWWQKVVKIKAKPKQLQIFFVARNFQSLYFYP
jgi:hypothetical protein